MWCYDNIAKYALRYVNFQSSVASPNSVASPDAWRLGLGWSVPRVSIAWWLVRIKIE